MVPGSGGQVQEMDMEEGKKGDASGRGRWTGCDKEAKREGGVAEDENHSASGPVPGSQALPQTGQTNSRASWLWHLVGGA